MASGIDISHHNGVIDWPRVASDAHIDFVILKATEGVTCRDGQFEANLANLSQWQKNKKSLGAYHFFHPNHPAEAQANHFSDVLLRVANGISFAYLALDVEVADGCSPDNIAVGVRDFFNQAKSRLQNSAVVSDKLSWLIYTSPNFWNERVDPVVTSEGKAALTSIITDHALWVADYTKQSTPTLPKGWKHYLIWQYSDQGRIHGIKTVVDLNIR